MRASLITSFSFFLLELVLFLVVEEKGEEFGKCLEGFLVKVTPFGVKHAHEFPIGCAFKLENEDICVLKRF